jgi:ATP-dependent Clp protease ATP-binding subunit ClpC
MRATSAESSSAHHNRNRCFNSGRSGLSEINLPFVTICQKWGENRELIGVLGLPSLLRIGNSRSDQRQIRAYWQSQIQELEPQTLHSRVFPDSLQISHIPFELPAPRSGYLEWNQCFELRISYLNWQISAGRWVGFAPAFGVQAVAARQADLAAAIQIEVLAVLARSQASKKLAHLFPFSQPYGLQFFVERAVVKLPSPRQRHEKKTTNESNDETLTKVAKRITADKLPAAFLLDQQVRQLAELLGHRQPASVLLVGPAGVGKTAAFQQLIRTAANWQLSDFEFWRTDGSNLIAGMAGFGQWQERCQKLVDELAKEKSVLHLGNLIELSEVGRGGGATLGIADFLLPLIGQGKLLAVAECTPEQLAIAQKQIPRLLDVFTQIEFTAPEPVACGEILVRVAAESPVSANITADAISLVEQLHRRFAKYSPMPGRAIGFLKNLLEDNTAPDQRIDSESVIQAFSRQSCLPEFLLSQHQPLDIARTETWFSERLIGQPEPIEWMVDAIASIKSNLNRPGRPIGSFLFIGPTGVGKTEMAKTIAEYMFGDPKRLVRIDMSEYHQPLAVARLIGATGSGDGVLTNKVRENPFSVLLLDEIEKADPGVFDLLLQVLGEGRLTDGRGQTSDFTNSIVILTSNLGVESYRVSGLGFQATTGDTSWREHFLKKIQQFFRPEFVNRLDRIVPFAPLDLPSIKKIAARELELVRLQTLASQRRRGQSFDHVADRDSASQRELSTERAIGSMGQTFRQEKVNERRLAKAIY